MRTWTDLHFDLEDTIPCVTNHGKGSSVTMHTAGYNYDNKGNRGVTVEFYSTHIPVLKQILMFLQENEEEAAK